MERNKFGHLKFSEYQNFKKSDKFIEHPKFGWIRFHNGWSQYYIAKNNKKFSIVGFTDEEDKISYLLDVISVNFDFWIVTALELIEPQEPCEREFRRDLNLYSIITSELDKSQFRFSLMFHFLGPEDWDGNPSVDVLYNGDSFEFKDMNWPT